MNRKTTSILFSLTAAFTTAQAEMSTQGDILDIKKSIFLIDPMWFAYGAVGLLVGGFLIWIAIKIIKALSGPSKITALLPWEIAVSKLKKAREWLAQETSEQYCTAVSVTLREFIESHFDLNATEQTTEEFFADPKLSGKFTQEQKAELQDFSEQCDLAKFAKQGLGTEDMEKLHSTATSFVETTGKPNPDEKR